MDVSSGVVLFVWCSVLVDGLSWCDVFGVCVRCCVIIYYILYISYTILFSSSDPSSLLLFILPSSSDLSSPNPLPLLNQSSSSSHTLPSLPFPCSLLLSLSSILSFILYLSVLTYTYLYSIPSDNLTPHVLSEWMVEVCRFDEYRFMF